MPARKNIDVAQQSLVEKPAEKKPKVYDKHDLIMCRSVTSGTLYIDGDKSYEVYKFADYGDEVGIEYQDLSYAVAKEAKWLKDAYLIVIDKDFVAQNQKLSKWYENMYTEGDLRDILVMPVDQMRKTVEQLPDSTKDTLKSLAASEIENGFMDSISRIKELDNLLGTTLVDDLR